MERFEAIFDKTWPGIPGLKTARWPGKTRLRALGSAVRLGPLTHSEPNHMGLNCLPVPCSCGNHAVPENVHDGFTHPEGEPCPFREDGFPVSADCPCCSIQLTRTVLELAAMGEEKLAASVFLDMTAESAIFFGATLKSAAIALEERFEGSAKKPRGAGREGGWDPKKGKCVWRTYSTFDQAIGAIREAGRWYQKVGTLGFGVHPRSLPGLA